jgi:hypothetical protein
LGKKSKFEKNVKHLKGIDQSSKNKGYNGITFKKKMEKPQENTENNGKESFNETPKPITSTMGC